MGGRQSEVMANPPIELMFSLVKAGVPDAIGPLIMAYMVIPSPRAMCEFNRMSVERFFTDPRRYHILSHDLTSLGEIDQYSIWGQVDEVEQRLKEKWDLDEKKEIKRDGTSLRLLLTTSIEGEDHRGPGFITPGTPFQRALGLGDFLNEDRRGQTMVSIFERYVKQVCGMEEFNRQLKQAQRNIVDDYKRKAETQEEDKRALESVWNILLEADENTLRDNQPLQAALAKFETQLKKPGNEKVIHEAEKMANNTLGVVSKKMEFAKNSIIGLAQVRRLAACDLQICSPQLPATLRKKIITERFDIRSRLGIVPGAQTHRSMFIGLFLGSVEELYNEKIDRYKRLWSIEFPELPSDTKSTPETSSYTPVYTNLTR